MPLSTDCRGWHFLFRFTVAGRSMASSPSDKADLRRAALAARDGLDAAWRANVSVDLVRFAGDIGVARGTRVSGFWPIRSEIDPRPLMASLEQRGAQLCLPAVVDRTTIVFRRYVSGDPLVDGGFGTAAPGPNAPECDPQIMLVPLSAFDGDGNRIGYGAGHYDRAVARLIEQGRKPVLIGLGFECQRMPGVPAEAHDVPLDAVVTEAGPRWFSPRS